jgi:hypothetical protein
MCVCACMKEGKKEINHYDNTKTDRIEIHTDEI